MTLTSDYCAPNPLCNYTSTTPVGWQSPGSWRDSFDILYSCLATLVACAWSILALNVPAKSDKRWRKFLRRVKWMCITLAFPEFLTAVAVIEHWHARQTRDDIRQTLKPNAELWTTTHGFFANMGGYVLVSDDRDPFPLIGETLQILIANDLVEIPDTELDAIKDRSKTDTFARVFALLQLIWTVIKSIARYEEDLPLAPLEVITAWFILPSVLSFFLEWPKPKDVDVPIEIRYRGKIEQGIFDKLSAQYFAVYDKKLEDTRTGCVTRIPFARPVNYYFGDDIFRPKWVKALMLVVLFAMGAYNAAHIYVHPDLFEAQMLPVWHISNLIAFVLPLFLIAVKLIMDEIDGPAIIFKLLLPICAIIYAVARLIPLGLGVATLMVSLPVNAYYDINWTNFIPHF